MGENEKEDHMKIRVQKVILAAFIIPWLMRREFLNKVSLPILLLMALGYLGWFLGDVAGGLGFLFSFLQLLIYAYFAVTCHRIVLLGGESVPRLGIRKWTSRETRFFGWLVGIYLMVGIASLTLIMLPSILSPVMEANGFSMVQVLFIAAVIPGLYLLARLSMIFPATAVDERPNIKWAWEISQGNGWRLVVIVGIFPVITGWILKVMERADSTLIEDLVLFLISFIVIIIEIAAVSLSYRELTAGQSNYAPQPTQ